MRKDRYHSSLCINVVYLNVYMYISSISPKTRDDSPTGVLLETPLVHTIVDRVDPSCSRLPMVFAEEQVSTRLRKGADLFRSIKDIGLKFLSPNNSMSPKSLTNNVRELVTLTAASFA